MHAPALLSLPTPAARRASLRPLAAALLLCGVSALPAARAAPASASASASASEDVPGAHASGARAHRPAARAAASVPQLEVSPDGQYVIDRRVRLLWPRCVEGMRWNGQTCTGMALLLTHKQAQTLAAERARQEGVRWRLPRVNELRRLIVRDIRPQGLSPELFPAAPRGWHWTGTAAVNARPVNPYNYSNIGSAGPAPQLSTQQAWAIDLDSLESRPDMGRGNQLMVRLVRPLPAELAGNGNGHGAVTEDGAGRPDAAQAQD